MYDLSGLRNGQVRRVLSDYRQLMEEHAFDRDARYLKHRGKPLVAVWGIGFNDGRRYTLSECVALVEALKEDGCAVMLGVPSFWRDGTRDATDDEQLKNLIGKADIVSPWTVGRYQTPQQAIRHAESVWRTDQDWCDARGVDFLPVAFPGFSWHQLKGSQLNLIRGEEVIFSGLRSSERIKQVVACFTLQCSTKSMKELRFLNVIQILPLARPRIFFL